MNRTSYSSPLDPLFHILGFFFRETPKADLNPNLDPAYKALHDKIVVEFLNNCKRLHKTREAEMNKAPRIYTITFLQLEDWGKISDQFTDIKLDKRNPSHVKEWAGEWIERIARMAQVCKEIKNLTDKKKSNPNEVDQVREDLRIKTEELGKLSEAGRQNLNELLKNSSHWPVPCQQLIQSMDMKWARLNAFRTKPEELSMCSEGVQLIVDPNSNPVNKNTLGVDAAFRAIFQIQETKLFAVDANYNEYFATVVQPKNIELSTCGFPKQSLTEVLREVLPLASRIYCQTDPSRPDTSNKENMTLPRWFPVVWHDKLPINQGHAELRDDTSIKIARTVDRAIATIRAKISKNDFTYDPAIEQQVPTAMLGGGRSLMMLIPSS